jgi:nitrogen fixation NifU-like protein
MNLDIYHQRIKLLARRPNTSNQLLAPDVAVQLDNRLCGDQIQLELNCENDLIIAVYHRVRGCLLCDASANVLASVSVGLTTAELQQITQQLTQLLTEPQAQSTDNSTLSAFAEPWQDLALFSPVANHRSRHQCVLLPFQAMQQALAQV